VPLEALCALADAPGRLGEMRLIEDDFHQLMACEEKEHPDIAVVRNVLTAGWKLTAIPG
jgi:hypothetical protein